jgi:RimJ/RimL family protein N-acetyltransferase
MAEFPDPWPLRHLVLRTPRLELRPDDDAGVLELVDEAYQGVHPPEFMPFAEPWTDAPYEEIGANTVRYHWQVRALHRPNDWRINFLIRHNGRVIGTQGLYAKEFAVIREAETGSWIGMRHQGKGYGTEMRMAVLMFLFDCLGADRARSSAFEDNTQSRAVSRRLGYVEDGTFVASRRGKAAREIRLVLTRERFAEFRPEWTLEVDGFDLLRPSLVMPEEKTGPGATPTASHPD